MKYTPIAIAVVVLVAIISLFTSIYIVTEKDQVFITRFGKIQGKATIEPGLYFKVPFIDKVRRFERRILEWDGHPSEVTTKDKRFIVIDTYARWKIEDPKVFFERVKDEVFAQSRLDDILDGATRTAVSKHDLVEVVRSEQRVAAVDDNQTEGKDQQLQPFTIGRQSISSSILEESREKVKAYGIKLLDFQFKRINYATTVQTEIFNRMIAERKKIADEFRSKGLGEAEDIAGKQQKDLATIQSEATRRKKEIEGEGDANATRIYAEAYSQSPQSEEFYKFIKTMETYKLTLSQKDTLILSTKSDFFNFLNEIKPVPKAEPK